jgi:hypothetical protein
LTSRSLKSGITKLFYTVTRQILSTKGTYKPPDSILFLKPPQRTNLGNFGADLKLPFPIDKLVIILNQNISI